MATGRRAPVLLVLEDGHWADHPTLLLLRHLGRAAAEARLLVVATFRGHWAWSTIARNTSLGIRLRIWRSNLHSAQNRLSRPGFLALRQVGIDIPASTSHPNNFLRSQ